MAGIDWQEMAERAKCRAGVYGLLVPIFGGEPEAELLARISTREFREALHSLGVDLDGELEPGRADELAVEYTRLFLGPGPHIPPYESVHREGEGKLYGESSVHVREFVRSLGLEYRPGGAAFPDHIEVEFELMQKLIAREQEAWEAKDIESAKRCLEFEDTFIREHLGQWVPGFCDRVIDETTSTFYRNMAKLAREYVRLEEKEVPDLFSKVKAEQ